MDPEQEYRQRQQVLNSYRAFLSQKLEPELHKAHEERVQVEEKIADYRSLLTQIESLEKTTTKRENEEGEEEEDDDKKEPRTTTVRIDLGSETIALCWRLVLRRYRFGFLLSTLVSRSQNAVQKAHRHVNRRCARKEREGGEDSRARGNRGQRYQILDGFLAMIKKFRRALNIVLVLVLV